MNFKPTSAELINSAELIAEVSHAELSLDDLDGVVGGAGWIAGTIPSQTSFGSQATGTGSGSNWASVPSLPVSAWGKKPGQ